MLTKTLRNILTLILSLSLLLNILNQAIVYYSFLLQREYIVKNLCVERNSEKNTCQGCCQLEKKLKEAEPEKSSDIPYPESKVKEITIFPFEPIQRSNCKPAQITAAINPYIFEYQFLFYPSIFHPPRFIT